MPSDSATGPDTGSGRYAAQPLAHLEPREKITLDISQSTASLLTRSLKAAEDLKDGLVRWELWGTLGWHDIRQRYRRSIIGPFWLTLSMGVMVGTIGFVYAGLFGQEMRDYLPFVALGFIVWNLISGVMLEACNVFTGSEGIIRQIRAPLSTHVFRMLWRNVVIFGHNLVIYVVVALMFDIRPGMAALLAIPGLLLVWLNGLWVGLLFGTLSARFRDFAPTLTAAMPIFFFVTPIVWKVEQLRDRSYIVDYNPMYYFIELIRMPLLGQPPWPSIWVAVVACTLLGCAVAFAFFQRFRGRISYWV